MRRVPESGEVRVIPVHGMPEIAPGSALLDEILRASRRQRSPLRAGDILVVTHKVVSKAEGGLVELAQVKPSARAKAWARRYPVDARAIELALREAGRIVRMKKGVLITQTRSGLVCANSGVDLSNVDGGKSVVLLPRNPDRSAALLHRDIRAKTGLHVPVIITDSFGRPWREGLTEVAIGVAGMKPMRDLRRRRDPYGYKLRVSLEAVADALAAMAGAACGKLSRCPACIIRGFSYERGRGCASDLVRPSERDLFR
ncbi:MAG TPA: coenzyme F420-0:L-glutamate ligase [Terriglobales bacterium]|nr:coenzyme F420-0:L-glutamate ligase [Terriglobales bacterium]